MRTLVAGLSESAAQELLGFSGPRITDLQVLPSWRHLEAAVEREQPELLVVYVAQDPRNILTRVGRIKQWYPRVHVIAVADDASHGLTGAIDEVGCADVVVLELGARDMSRAIDTLVRREGTSRGGEAIAFLGGKGGVGTTMLATNTAACLASQGAKTVVVDLHLYLGDVALLMGVEALPSLHWFVSRPHDFDPMMYAMSAPRHRTGLSVIGLQGDLAQAEPVSADAAIRLVEDLRKCFEYVIVDCGSALNEETLAIMSAVDRRLLVTAEERACLEGVQRRIKSLEPLGLNPASTNLVVNRAHADRNIDWQAIEKSVGCSVFGHVRNAWQEVAGAQERRQLLLEYCPDELVTRDVMTIARYLSPRQVREKVGIGDKLRRMFA